MTPPTKSAVDTAALLERLGALEAKEEMRERLIAEREAAQERLEQIQNKQATREVRSLGSATAYRQCSNPRCSDFDTKHPVEILGEETVQFVKDSQGNVTSQVENSWRHWNLAQPSDGICGSCSRNVGFIGEPGSVNALENVNGWVHDNRSAWLEKMRREGRTQTEIDKWAERWTNEAE
jgi:hypothetical protein